MTTAVITGAGSGMGNARAWRVSAVSLTCSSQVDLDTPNIVGAVGVACDISDAASVIALVERVETLGRSVPWSCGRDLADDG